MPHRFALSLLVQGLTLLLLGPACEASSLGLTVHVVPLDGDGGNTVRAHFSAIAPSPCPALSGLCAAGEDCLLHPTSSPFQGSLPSPGWCVRQWQKTVPSNYNASVTLGSNTEFYVWMRTGPKVRANTGRLNQPASVALPPPLRARVNCPHHFYLSVKDVDGDKVRCRFARPEQGECLSCARHSFIELEEEKCMLTFTGEAPAGRYFIHLMAEDHIPVPKTVRVTDTSPLSSVPVHLSLTVEESTSSCSDEPVATGETPTEDSTLFILPYQEVKLDVNFMSQLESLQSEPRCVWLYQREMRTLPAGTELKCEKTEMSLVLPVASLSNIKLDELQLNSPTCPVSYNNTHLTARISLSSCGTKTVHSGSELVYTNTLQSVRPYTVVSRQPSLILPLACRIPGAQVKGPQYKITMPTENETFGEVTFWIEFHLPGEGPLATFTRIPRLRSVYIPPVQTRRVVRSPSESNSTSAGSTNGTSSSGVIGSRIKQLDLHVLSNCSVDRAELVVSNCLESETEDFAVSSPILEQGCATSNSTLEVILTQSNSKIYRLDLSKLEAKGSTMYVQCTVNLCIATMPSQKCPDLCTRSINHRMLVNSVFTKTYTIRSGPVSLVVTATTPPTTANTATTAATTTTSTTTTATASVTSTSAAQNTTTSHAPPQASSVAAGVILTAVGVFLQNIFLY
ncbi:mucin-2-like isoform X2 [Seriola aureovittata]|uniref:mucin-2-like isoform X2 n=1 Tax=Seriola aureovittata TaxID=2871759 RepID=UPI0024BE7D5E|nr:mucin-2-like isoform X2 [Seriola aureovittata]